MPFSSGFGWARRSARRCCSSLQTGLCWLLTMLLLGWRSELIHSPFPRRSPGIDHCYQKFLVLGAYVYSFHLDFVLQPSLKRTFYQNLSRCCERIAVWHEDQRL